MLKENNAPFVILIGASGSGKTSIAEAIAKRHVGEIDVFHFDHIGVPSIEQMIAECGSGIAWQRAKTLEWMTRLAPFSHSGRPLLFEGQTRLDFLAEGAAAAGTAAYRPILVDCDDETRSRRLSGQKQQPELANETMMKWARHLRHQARESVCEILDTTGLSLEQCIGPVLARLRGQQPTPPTRGGERGNFPGAPTVGSNQT